MTPESTHIVVMGVGNILLRDEGAGVRAVDRLRRFYSFPDRVELIDGGLQGLNLITVLERAGRLILFDAVLAGAAPGTIQRFSWGELRPTIERRNAGHQLDFMETMTLLESIGRQPQTVVIGVEPEEVGSAGLDLSPAAARAVPEMNRMALEQLARWGVIAEKRDRPLAESKF